MIARVIVRTLVSRLWQKIRRKTKKTVSQYDEAEQRLINVRTRLEALRLQAEVKSRNELRGNTND